MPIDRAAGGADDEADDEKEDPFFSSGLWCLRLPQAGLCQTNLSTRAQPWLVPLADSGHHAKLMQGLPSSATQQRRVRPYHLRQLTPPLQRAELRSLAV